MCDSAKRPILDTFRLRHTSVDLTGGRKPDAIRHFGDRDQPELSERQR
jgi:hypothetical protein